MLDSQDVRRLDNNPAFDSILEVNLERLRDTQNDVAGRVNALYARRLGEVATRSA